MQNSRVEGFFHYGIAVRNLEDVTDFFVRVFGLQVVAKREIRANYIEDLVGSQGVWAEVVMLELGGSGFLELLRWHEVVQSPASVQGSITSVGAQHLCLFVNDVDLIVGLLESFSVVEMISMGVTQVTEGPNTGARIAFILVDKILYVELFERHKLTN